MDILVEVNDAIVEKIRKIKSLNDKFDDPPPSSGTGPEEEKRAREEKSKEVPNQGKLLVDATCPN